jgi:hypothetical protein
MSEPEDRPDEPSLLSQVCDIVRYAPIAILLDGPGMLPKLAEQGKVHVGNARYLGRRAVREAEPALRRLAEGVGEQAGGLLQLVGLVPPPAPSDGDHDGGRATATRRSPVTTTTADPGPTSPDRGNGAAPADLAPVGPAVEELAIPDYESLSASHVVNRLPGLTPDELEAVRRYEAAHRGRKTILNKVAQLQAPA